MSDHIYKKVELIGSSPISSDEAVNNAIQQLGKSIHNLRWFEIIETRGQVEGNKVGIWQVTLEVGFTLDES